MHTIIETETDAETGMDMGIHISTSGTGRMRTGSSRRTRISSAFSILKSCPSVRGSESSISTASGCNAGISARSCEVGSTTPCLTCRRSAFWKCASSSSVTPTIDDSVTPGLLLVA